MAKQMEITSIRYLTASPYMSRAQIANEFGCSNSTMARRLNELDEQVQKGRYSDYTILDGGGVVYINYLAFVDYLKYRKKLQDGRRVPPFNPDKVAKAIGWGEMTRDMQ